ncbi:hypothetical protein [Actinoplanes friuliensis]|uniref:Lipoprotein n=1 Tax=Actinoplanes friuliensis DSM 7358 TaxID=1246995 RepID=U5W0P3_9ACTN|nr:hypothetical protein [Actinoplanes friuliensis]AGZ41516.1 hypothetical protein AFR_16170 [Actinoplanes friuliensis DSM 7358]
MITDKLVPRVVAVLAVGLAAAGCANGGAADTSTDGRQALTQSLQGLQTGNYTFTRTGGRAAEGSVHLPESSMISDAYGPTVLRTGRDFFMKYRIHGEGHEQYGKLYDQYAGKATTKKEAAELRKAKEILRVLDGTRWVRADEKRLVTAAAEDDLSGMENLPPTPTAAKADITGATALIDAAVTAKLSGSTITGTLDATKVDPELGILTNDPYYVYGPRAKSMTFKATVDDGGRLTQLTVDLPGPLQDAASQPPEGFPSDAPTTAAEPPLTITVSAYGETAVQGPPEGATDLDPAAYEMLTNDVD